MSRKFPLGKYAVKTGVSNPNGEFYIILRQFGKKSSVCRRNRISILSYSVNNYAVLRTDRSSNLPRQYGRNRGIAVEKALHLSRVVNYLDSYSSVGRNHINDASGMKHMRPAIKKTNFTNWHEAANARYTHSKLASFISLFVFRFLSKTAFHSYPHKL